MIKRLLKFTAVLLPALLGIALCTVIGKRIVDHYKNRGGDFHPAASGSLLPRAPLVNIETHRDEYPNVTKGRVLLVFISTGCDACRKELSNLSQAMPSLAAKVKIYGVGVEERDEVARFVQGNHDGFPILLDHGATVLARLGFRFMPTKVLLRDGEISRIWYGSSPDKAALIKDVVEVDTK